jgi:hypothetical protein
MSIKQIFLLLIVLSTITYITPDEVNNSDKLTNPDEESTRADTKNKSDNIEPSSDEDEPKDWDKLFDDIKGYRIRSEQEINFLLKVTDLTFLRFVYRKSSPKSRKIAGYLKNINEKLGGLAGIMQIDCDIFQPKDYSQCQDNPYMVDSYPRLKLLIPPENRYNAMTKELENYYEFPWTADEMTENNIYSFITVNMPYFIKRLNENNIHSFLNNNLFNKVIIFTNKKNPSILTKGLTNNFYDRLLFGEVQETEKALVERFNIKTFPTLLVYKVFDHTRLIDEPEIIPYEGLIKADKIIEFLQPHALKEKRYVSEGRKIYEDDIRHISTGIEFRTINESNYEEYFNKFQNKNIMVFFNTHDSMKLMYKTVLVRNHDFFITAFFNCDEARKFCLDKFNVRKFPSLIAFLPHNESTITHIEERITNSVLFPIGKGYKEVDFIEQIREVFPSRVETVSSINLPFLIQEAKVNKQYVIVDMYLKDEDVKYLNNF